MTLIEFCSNSMGRSGATGIISCPLGTGGTIAKIYFLFTPPFYYSPAGDVKRIKKSAASVKKGT